jgi:RNA polymerase sigma factor (sigma-70 family)
MCNKLLRILNGGFGFRPYYGYLFFLLFVRGCVFLQLSPAGRGGEIVTGLATTIIDANNDDIIDDDNYKNTIVTKISSVIRVCVRHSKINQHTLFYEDQDFVQEIWLRLLSDGGRILRQYNAARGTSFEQYISMIARREIGNLLRKERANKRSSRLTVELKGNIEAELSPYTADTADRYIESRDLVKKLNRWLRSVLSSHGIDILNATFLDGLDATVAAKNLGVSVQTVYNWQHKIRTLSRRFLSDPIGPPQSRLSQSVKDES